MHSGCPIWSDSHLGRQQYVAMIHVCLPLCVVMNLITAIERIPPSDLVSDELDLLLKRTQRGLVVLEQVRGRVNRCIHTTYAYTHVHTSTRTHTHTHTHTRSTLHSWVCIVYTYIVYAYVHTYVYAHICNYSPLNVLIVHFLPSFVPR